MVLRGISKHGDAVHLCVKKAVINVLVPYLHARLINEFHEARTTNDLKADEKYAEEDAWVCARLNNAAFVATAGIDVPAFEAYRQRAQRAMDARSCDMGRTRVSAKIEHRDSRTSLKGLSARCPPILAPQ